MKEVAKVKKMLRTAQQTLTIFDKYKEATSVGSCDKHGLGFNLDRRFSSASINLSVDSWTGYYGSSSCSTFFTIDDREVFERHLLKVLQQNFKNIILQTAESIRKEASKRKEQALKELEENLSIINSL